MEDVLVRYLAWKSSRVSLNYLRDHGTVLRSIIRDFGGISNALESDRNALESWMARKLLKVKGSTVVAYIFAFDLFLEWCKEQGLVSVNIAKIVELPRFRRPLRKQVGSKEMVRILIAECEDPALKYILFAGFHAGMRKNEIISSKPIWFDHERSTIHIVRDDMFDTKDGEDRSLPLTTDFAAYLRVYPVKGGYMLSNWHSKPGARYRYDFRVKYENYMLMQCMRHGFPRLTIHDMRRTFASIIASSRAVSMYELARWMGDDLKVVTRCYAHLAPHDQQIDLAF